MKTIIFLLTPITIPIPAHAIFDYLGEATEDRLKAAAYAQSVVEVLSEIDESSAVAKGAAELVQRQAAVDRKLGEAESIGRETKSLSESDWGSGRLSESLTYTSRFVKRAKSLLVRMGLVGTDVATAMNTAETNLGLTEIVKNQQAQILMQKEERLFEREKAIKEREEWELFIREERNRRGQL